MLDSLCSKANHIHEVEGLRSYIPEFLSTLIHPISNVEKLYEDVIVPFLKLLKDGKLNAINKKRGEEWEEKFSEMVSTFREQEISSTVNKILIVFKAKFKDLFIAQRLNIDSENYSDIKKFLNGSRNIGGDFLGKLFDSDTATVKEIRKAVPKTTPKPPGK